MKKHHIKNSLTTEILPWTTLKREIFPEFSPTTLTLITKREMKQTSAKFCQTKQTLVKFQKEKSICICRGCVQESAQENFQVLKQRKLLSTQLSTLQLNPVPYQEQTAVGVGVRCCGDVGGRKSSTIGTMMNKRTIINRTEIRRAENAQMLLPK